MNIKKTIGLISLLALGTGLLGYSEGVLLYKGKKGNKGIEYRKTMESHLKEEAKMKALHTPKYLDSNDFECKPAYLMEITLPNDDIYRIRDVNMDEKITPEGNDRVSFIPKGEHTQWYDNSTNIGKLMLEKADKLYQEMLIEIKESIPYK